MDTTEEKLVEGELPEEEAQGFDFNQDWRTVAGIATIKTPEDIADFLRTRVLVHFCQRPGNDPGKRRVII